MLIISSTIVRDASKAGQATRNTGIAGSLSPQHRTSSSMRFLLSTRSEMPLLQLVLLYIEASHSRMDTIAAASLLFHFYRKGKHYSFHYSHGLPPQISQCAFQSSLQWHRCRRTAPELESNYLFIFFNHENGRNGIIDLFFQDRFVCSNLKMT